MTETSSKKPTLHMLNPRTVTVEDIIGVWEALTGKKATPEQWAKTKAVLEKEEKKSRPSGEMLTRDVAAAPAPTPREH